MKFISIELNVKLFYEFSICLSFFHLQVGDLSTSSTAMEVVYRMYATCTVTSLWQKGTWKCMCQKKNPQLENSYFDTNFVYEMFHTHHIAGGLINE